MKAIWHLLIGAAMVLAMGGAASAAEKAAADPFLGDWRGQWSGGRRRIFAQVIPRGGGRYQVNVLPELDRRCPPHAVLEAKADGGVLQFDRDGWAGRIEGGRFTGTGPQRGKPAPFAMEKVTRLSPRLGAKPPKGAVVLFDGSGFDQWEPRGREADKGITWKLLDGFARVWPPLKEHAFGTAIRARRVLADFHLHLEFRLPLLADAAGQTRANSGVIIEEYEFCEVQILDSYGLPGYYDECGAIYRKSAPKVNMCAPPGVWQSFDIDYRGPRFDASGSLTAGPRITVNHNGRFIHKDEELPYSQRARTARWQRRGSRKCGRITLQHHGDPIDFRNIWMTPLAEQRRPDASRGDR